MDQRPVDIEKQKTLWDFCHVERKEACPERSRRVETSLTALSRTRNVSPCETDALVGRAVLCTPVFSPTISTYTNALRAQAPPLPCLRKRRRGEVCLELGIWDLVLLRNLIAPVRASSAPRS